MANCKYSMLQTSTCINVIRSLKRIINQITTAVYCYNCVSPSNEFPSQSNDISRQERYSDRLGETFTMNLLVIVAALLMMRNTVDNLKT